VDAGETKLLNPFRAHQLCPGPWERGGGHLPLLVTLEGGKMTWGSNLASKYKLTLRQAAQRMLCSSLGAVLVHLLCARAPPPLDQGCDVARDGGTGWRARRGAGAPGERCPGPPEHPVCSCMWPRSSFPVGDETRSLVSL